MARQMIPCTRTSLGISGTVLGFCAWVSVTPTTPPPPLTPERVVEGVHHRYHDGHPRHRRHHGTTSRTQSDVLLQPDRTESPPATPVRECPEGMVHVRGDFCPDARQTCLEMSNDRRERCLRFRKPSRCQSRRTRTMDFCIDRYEWPNREGDTPAVLVSWNEAAALCHAIGRRLCTEDEWTLACEGPAMLPYPWGYERDATICNIDRHNLPYRRDVVTGSDRLRAQQEAARVSQAAPSGAYPRCESPYGVRDMTGNVDEWAVSRNGTPYRSVLKGGYWGRVRTRCRPATRRHDENFRYYQIGFRCCADLS